MAKKVKLGLNQAWTRLILAWEIRTGVNGMVLHVFFTPFSCTNVQVIWKTFACLKIARKKTFKTGAKVT